LKHLESLGAVYIEQQNIENYSLNPAVVIAITFGCVAHLYFSSLCINEQPVSKNSKFISSNRKQNKYRQGKHNKEYS